MHSAPMPTKLKLMQHAVLPIASYRMPRWPYQTCSASRLDRTQTKMIGILLGLRRQAFEDTGDFLKRRNRAAAGVARQQGRYSAVWRKRVIDWHSHLGREVNHSSWAAKTLHYKGKAWLQEQRRIHAVGQHSSLIAGRTCTRAAQGVLHRRWHDGVDVAQSW